MKLNGLPPEGAALVQAHCTSRAWGFACTLVLTPTPTLTWLPPAVVKEEKG